jgi:hypothetical protein
MRKLHAGYILPGKMIQLRTFSLGVDCAPGRGIIF